MVNTKQVLYDALQKQLEDIKADCEFYTNEVILPKRHDLIDQIKGWFTTNFSTPFDEININEYSISLVVADADSIRFEFTNDRLDLRWYGGTICNGDDLNKSKYIKLLNESVDHYSTIKQLFYEQWDPLWRQILTNSSEKWEQYRNLDEALKNLKREIRTDYKNEMLNPGFELTSFKPHYGLDWDYADGERKYRINIEDKTLSIQVGRSQYDTIYVYGFKVLGKKGNKYEVEVIRTKEGSKQTYKVLEKKFEHFVNVVNDWEGVKADELKKQVEERFDKATRK